MQIYLIIKSRKAEKKPLKGKRARFKHRRSCCRRFCNCCCCHGKKWMFHHQRSCLSPGLYDFTIRTILYTELGLLQFFGYQYHRCQGLVCRQCHPADRRPTLFAGSRHGVLLLVHKGGAAGWPLICPGEPQEDLGGVSKTVTAGTFAAAFRHCLE